MKRLTFALSLAFMAMTCAFTSCSEEDITAPQNYEEVPVHKIQSQDPKLYTDKDTDNKDAKASQDSQLDMKVKTTRLQSKYDPNRS